MLLIKKLVLASGSPRRQSLLRQIGLQFEVRKSGVDEDISVSTIPEEIVKFLATRKAVAVGKSFDSALIIGADTIVVLDGTVLGKPQDATEAIDMLTGLSGRTHSVYTGFTLLDRPSNQSVTDVEITRVTFRELSTGEIADYVHSGSPMDKAGAYGIQDDYGAVFVERIEGCFYNVVGFPLARFYVAMENFQNHLTRR